jgi:dynein heavy chain, axonemal
MLVGLPFSGKTTCYKVLAKAMTLAKNLGEASEYTTYYHVINPKSISINHLYGYSDPISKEWTEGILSAVYRKCANDRTMTR